MIAWIIERKWTKKKKRSLIKGRRMKARAWITSVLILMNKETETFLWQHLESMDLHGKTLNEGINLQLPDNGQQSQLQQQHRGLVQLIPLASWCRISRTRGEKQSQISQTYPETHKTSKLFIKHLLHGMLKTCYDAENILKLPRDRTTSFQIGSFS